MTRSSVGGISGAGVTIRADGLANRRDPEGNAGGFYRMFQRVFEEGLAQSSYLIGCDRTGEAVVIDPRRDVDAYVLAARAHGCSITYAIETHIHADFVSGARELAAIGARPVAGPGSGLRFPHHEATHGEKIRVGDVQLTILHTPGHTPEHVSVLVEEPGGPTRVLTGDTLFVGAVGRPDLLGEDVTRRLAGELFDSIHGSLLVLKDDVEVHPGHGAGSLCGAGIEGAASSTIGEERRTSELLQHRSRDAFVAAVLADLPETPPYFARMKEVNCDGPDVLGLAAPPAVLPVLQARAAAAAAKDGALLIDMRDADAFARAHPEGAIHLEHGPKVGAWAGWVIPAGARLILLAADARQAEDARRQLLRVGLESVVGWVEGGIDSWQHEGLPVSGLARMSARALLARRASERITIVDVRSGREFEQDHITGAVHVPLDEVAQRARDFGSDSVIATICETGYRSSLAASLLERAGIRQVTSVAGGMAEYRMTAVPS